MTEPSTSTRVLAALERDDTAAAVLATAVRFGEMAGAGVDAVHAGPSVPVALDTLTRRADLVVRRVDLPAGPALVAELGTPQLRGIVIGAGFRHVAPHPVGATTRYVAQHVDKPVLVVPITMHGVPRPLRRLLVPLEGTEASSLPVLEALLPLLHPDVDVDVLHVFTDATVPRMLDRPMRDAQLLGREFLARHCPPATHIVLRGGEVADRIAQVCAERGADMIVLSWSQISEHGRARVVRHILEHSAVPVLLVPAGQRGPTALLQPSASDAR